MKNTRTRVVWKIAAQEWTMRFQLFTIRRVKRVLKDVRVLLKFRYTYSLLSLASMRICLESSVNAPANAICPIAEKNKRLMKRRNTILRNSGINLLKIVIQEMLPFIWLVLAASDITLFLNISKRIGFTITGVLKNMQTLKTISSIAPTITRNTINNPEKDISTSYRRKGLSGIVFRGLVIAVKIQFELVMIMKMKISVRQ